MMRLSLSLPALALAAGLAASGEARAGHFQSLSASHTAYGVSQFNYGNVAKPARPEQPVVRLFNPNHVTQVAAFIIYQSARGQNAGTAEVYHSCFVRELGPHASIMVPGDEYPGFNPAGKPIPTYAEVIWAPIFPVTITTAATGGTTVGVATPPAHARVNDRKRDDDRKRDHDDDDDDDDRGKSKGRAGAGAPTASGGGTTIATRLADGLGGWFNVRGPNGEDPPPLAHPAMFTLPIDAVVPGQRLDAVNCVSDSLFALGLPDDVFADFGIQ